jgi:hypothetical protein
MTSRKMVEAGFSRDFSPVKSTSPPLSRGSRVVYVGVEGNKNHPHPHPPQEPPSLFNGLRDLTTGQTLREFVFIDSIPTEQVNIVF